MNEWMDETERLVNALRVDMDPRKATRIQNKINVSYYDNTRDWTFRPKKVYKLELSPTLFEDDRDEKDDQYDDD